MINRVILSRKVQKELRRLPRHIVLNLRGWIESVEEDGLEEVRRVPGYHDEPLRGLRAGQRSIRLSRAYRAIYLVLASGDIEFVSVEEISKHDY